MRSNTVRKNATENKKVEFSTVSSLLRENIYNYILRSGIVGVTDEEIRNHFGIAGDSERPRRNELVMENRVVNSGKRRILNSGRTAIVWQSRRVLDTVNKAKTATKVARKR